ncbi:MAG TPA: hypothetical protein PKU97_16405 [Kofleriaceae bacterium]|nr:hypothetical protein [Kofleriaceae bacterium]
MRNSTLFFTLLVSALSLATLAAPAEAARRKQVRFAGIHTVPKGHGGGLCHIEAPHVHVYAPEISVQYREHLGQQVFVGDPVAYGWDGERYSYYGHHPIHVNVLVGTDELDEEYCYLDGPHYHAFTPPPPVVADFRLEGGAYFYIGTPPPVYMEARPAMVKINAVYQPIVYDRPVVTVTPPQGWIGVRFAAREVRPTVVAPVVRGGAVVEVHAPVIEIVPPSIDIGIGIGVGVGVVGGTVVDRPRGHKHKKHKKHRGRGRW